MATARKHTATTARPRSVLRAGLLVFTATCLGAPVALAVPAGAERADGSRPAPATVVRATTVVTGSHSAMMSIVLPRAVTIRTEGGGTHPADIAVTGTGRYFGVLLRRDGNGRNLTAGLMSVRSDPCSSPGCVSRYHEAADVDLGLGGYADPAPLGSGADWAYPPADNSDAAQEGLYGRLPAGRYQLYLVADGAPVRVTMRFRGVGAGSVTVHPTQPAPVRIVTAPADVEQPAPGAAGAFQDSVYSAGKTFWLPDRGAAWVAYVWKWLPHRDEGTTASIYGFHGAATPDATGSRYQQQCGPGGAVGSIRTDRPLPANPSPVATQYFTWMVGWGVLQTADQGHAMTMCGVLDTSGASFDAHLTILWVPWG